MSAKQRFEDHAMNLGKLLGNLQSIEMGARLAIVKLDSREAAKVQSQLSQVREGGTVELNAFSNADDLRQTLEKFNKRAPLACRLDVDFLVQLRDALAHGRTFGVGTMPYLKLLKFGRRPDDSGGVQVELAIDMTPAWFTGNITRLNAAMDKVRQALDYEQRQLS